MTMTAQATSSAVCLRFFQTQPVTLFPGALGTELQRRGYNTALPLWSAAANLDAYDLVTQIHRDYFIAGADIAVTNTFRTTPRTFAKIDHADMAYEALQRAVAAARAAQDAAPDRPTFVAGSFAPLEDCYRPDLVPSPDALAAEHGQQAEWLTAAGVDFLLPETICALPEARAMAQAAHETGLPFLVSFVIEEDGALLDGTPLSAAVQATNLPGRFGVLLNCRPIDILDAAFQRLCTLDIGLRGLYPNGIGKPDDALGWIFDNNPDSIEKFVSAARHWHAQGARILGGCCGTTPDYIQALSNNLRP